MIARFIAATVAFLFLFSSADLQAQPHKRILKTWEKGQYEKCLQKCRKELEKDHRDLDALLYKARCLAALNSSGNTRYKSGVEQALRSVKMLNRKDKDGSFARENREILAEIGAAALAKADELQEAGKDRRSQKLLATLQEVANDPGTRLAVADWFYAQGEYAKAWPAYRAETTFRMQKTEMSAADEQIFVRTVETQPSHHPYPFHLMDSLAERFGSSSKLADVCFERMEEVDIYSFTRRRPVLDRCQKYAATFSDDRFSELYWDKCGDIAQRLFKYPQADKPEQLQEFLTEITYDESGAAAHFDRVETMFNQLTERVTYGSDSDQRETYSPRILATIKGWFGKKENINDEVDAVVAFIDRQFKNDNLMAAASYTWHGRRVHKRSRALRKRENELAEQVSKVVNREDRGDLNTEDLASMSGLYPEMEKLTEMRLEHYLGVLQTALDHQDFSTASKVIRMARNDFSDSKEFMALKKQIVSADFLLNYRGSNLTHDELGFEQRGSCSGGTIDPAANEKVLQRLRYVRRLAGVPDDCYFDEEWNERCQAAAWMMTKNGQLSHHPEKSWDCYSEAGYKGASTSNLSLGHHSTSALMGQMRDRGTHNKSAGHRRWILYPRKKVFGHGSAPSSMALGCLSASGDGLTDEEEKWFRENPVVWPPADYVPKELVYARWSMSITGADFEDARVSMRKDGRTMKSEVISRNGGYGSSTIVWEPAEAKAEEGAVYTVTVSNVEINGKYESFTYEVLPIVID